MRIEGKLRIKLSWNHFILYSILNHNNTRIGKAQTLGYKSVYRFKRWHFSAGSSEWILKDTV